MPSPFIVVVVWLSLWSACDQVASDDVTTSGVVMTNGKQGIDVQETTAFQLSSDSVTSESTAVPPSSAESSNVGLDLRTLTMVEGTSVRPTKSSLETTDTIEFRVLAGLSCKWVDGNGVERQSRVCPLESTCNLGPITIAKKSGLDQRLYFCTGDQNLLVSIACRLEDKDRVIVLPRCVTGSRCSIGPLSLSYRGRQVQGYFCDARMLQSSSSSDRTERGGGGAAADTWTASGRSRLDRQREQGPGRSSDGKDHGKDHGSSKDGENHDGDIDGDHVHHGSQDRESEWHATATTGVVEETSTADTLDRKRVPGTTA